MTSTNTIVKLLLKKLKYTRTQIKCVYIAARSLWLSFSRVDAAVSSKFHREKNNKKDKLIATSTMGSTQTWYKTSNTCTFEGAKETTTQEGVSKTKNSRISGINVSWHITSLLKAYRAESLCNAGMLKQKVISAVIQKPTQHATSLNIQSLNFLKHLLSDTKRQLKIVTEWVLVLKNCLRRCHNLLSKFFSLLKIVVLQISSWARRVLCCSALLLTRAGTLSRFSFMAQTLEHLDGFKLCPFFLLVIAVWILLKVWWGLK